MRKTLIPLLTLLPISLFGCASGEMNSSSLEDLSFEENSNVIFTEYFQGLFTNDRAFEIGNIGESDVSLADYKVIIYKSGKLSEPYEIQLEGTLKAKETFVVAYAKAADSIKSKANQIDETFPNIGKYPMSLFHKGRLVDMLGTIGYSLTWCDSVDLVRKNEYKIGRETFVPYDWIGYSNIDNANQLGTLDCPLSEEEILKGPGISSPYDSYPFFKENSTTLGGGGFIDVTVTSYIDGDTTKFAFPQFVNDAGYRNGTSVRYENIDTPEIYHGGSSPAMPWGDAAKDFTKGLLSKAKRIRLQSLPNVSITETYGRLLLYVWASNEAEGDDSFYLVNYEIVKNGFSEVNFSGDTSSKMLYKGISYYQYMIDAQNKAEKEGLRIHGQKDPNYQY